MEDRIIFQNLEIAAREFPWDEVQISIKRKPEGVCGFTFYLPQNEDFGFNYAFGYGDTPEEALADLQRAAGERDPERSRRKKIEELRLRIAKLESMALLLPPYRAPGQLGFGEERQRQAPPADLRAPINVESTREEQ